MNGFLERTLKEINEVKTEHIDQIGRNFPDLKKNNGEVVIFKITGEFSQKTYLLLITTRKKLTELNTKYKIFRNAKKSQTSEVWEEKNQEFLREVSNLQAKERLLEDIFWGQVASKIKKYKEVICLTVRKNWMVVSRPFEEGKLGEVFKISLN